MKMSRYRWDCGLAAAVTHVERLTFSPKGLFLQLLVRCKTQKRRRQKNHSPVMAAEPRSDLHHSISTGPPFFFFKSTTFSSFVWTFVSWVFTFLNPIFRLWLSCLLSPQLKWTQRHLWDFSAAVPSNHRLIWLNVKTREFFIKALRA